MMYKVVLPAALVSVALVITGVTVAAAQADAINIDVPAPVGKGIAGGSVQRQAASDSLLLATPAPDTPPITLAFQAKINWDLDNVSKLYFSDRLVMSLIILTTRLQNHTIQTTNGIQASWESREYVCPARVTSRHVQS